ncbi:hypothetical protein [Bradyrhizobium sp. 2TAF24]|uniref:hypothetical protein n=1 Tax=Bradyrhizobium sp. 2TAF24 TaxID=3233011 RepID=UPI003F93A8C7
MSVVFGPGGGGGGGGGGATGGAEGGDFGGAVGGPSHRHVALALATVASNAPAMADVLMADAINRRVSAKRVSENLIICNRSGRTIPLRNGWIWDELPAAVNASAAHKHRDLQALLLRCHTHHGRTDGDPGRDGAQPRVLLTPDFHVGIVMQSEFGCLTVR